MPIDSSIYLQQETPDFLGGAERAMRMRDMVAKRREDEGVKKAFAAGVVTNEDGTQSIDQKRTLGELMRVSPERAQAYDAEMVERDAAKQKMQYDKSLREADLISRAAGSVRDQGSYEQALGELGKQGVDVSQMPRAYDPNLVNRYRMMALSTKEQLENQLRSREVAVKEKEAGIKAKSDEALPFDSKKTIETLASKNANKISIKNMIDSYMGDWESLSDDQKVARGGQLLKVLNSPEGADAIGAEEAKRLGAKLEFAYGNFSNSNPTQFGRDLEGFKQQALGTSRAIEKAVASNQDYIDKTMGRRRQATAPEAQSVANKPMLSDYDKQAIEWAQNNPQNPKSAEILKMHGLGTAVGKR